MKFFISADIEGISGVVNKTHASPSGHDYARARKLMTDEVNTAVEALLENGATEIIVNDSHGPMTNILLEELNSKAQLITGTPKRLGMMEGIDNTYDGVLLIGYHSRMNTEGVLSHSYHGGVITNIRVNGKDAGELLMNSSVAGYFDVPVIMVSGDNILSNEAKDINLNIETAIVKVARGRYSAKCFTPEIAHEKIKDSINKAVKNIKKITAVKIEEPIDLEVTMMNSGMAEIVSIIPGVKITAPNIVSYRANTIIEAYQVLMCTTLIANNTL